MRLLGFLLLFFFLFGTSWLWYSFYYFSNGDLRFFWQEQLPELVHIPYAWDSFLNTGFGASGLGILWLDTYLSFTVSSYRFGFSWNEIIFLFWILPFFFLSFFSSYLLARHIFSAEKMHGIASGIIYTTNTYIFIVFSGGQMGISLAYAVAPFVLLAFIKAFDSKTLRASLIAGLILALQVLLDPRLVYITLSAVFLYWLCFSVTLRTLSKSVFYSFGIPLLITLLIHNYWIIPLILTRSATSFEQFGTPASFRFFSFADFSHAFSLLHPNWPENIFGKTYFLRPEFLMLPILAFASLLFFSNRTEKKAEYTLERRRISFFALLAILGVFLAKGANEPFGFINTWFFSYVPGMQMFRDASKWYLIIALSYALLIPFTLCHLAKFFRKKNNLNPYIAKFPLVVVVFIIFWICILTPGIQHRNSVQTKLPDEYVQLKDFLYGQKTFFRTIWIPKIQRFGFSSQTHPAAEFTELSSKADVRSVEQWLSSEKNIELLRLAGVKYIILPADTGGEIFLRDRRYNDAIYNAYARVLTNTLHATKKYTFGKIKVFELPAYNDRFFDAQDNTALSWKLKNPTRYKITLNNTVERVVFSERFDPHWVAAYNGNKVQSEEYAGFFNSFPVQENVSELDVTYQPQLTVYVGLMLSAATLFVVGILLFGRIL